MNHCGTCTLCCKVMRIDELEKPAGQWCSKCDKASGCSAYEARPQSCRAFECVWLQSQSRPGPLPPELRPDRSRVVMTVAADGVSLVLHVDPDRPGAHERGAVARIVSGAARRGGRVFVVCGEKRTVVQEVGR